MINGYGDWKERKQRKSAISEILTTCNIAKGKKEKIKKEIKNELSSLSIFSFSIPLSYLSVLALAFASMDDVDLQARKEIKDELTKKEKMQQ